MRDRHRVDVDVDDPRLRVDPLGDLVDVADGRDAGADVEELVDATAGQLGDRPAQERPSGAHGVGEIGGHGGDLLGELPVDLEVVRAAQEVVVDPRRTRSAEIDLRRERPRLFHRFALVHASVGPLVGPSIVAPCRPTRTRAPRSHVPSIMTLLRAAAIGSAHDRGRREGCRRGRRVVRGRRWRGGHYRGRGRPRPGGDVLCERGGRGAARDAVPPRGPGLLSGCSCWRSRCRPRCGSRPGCSARGGLRRALRRRYRAAPGAHCRRTSRPRRAISSTGREHRRRRVVRVRDARRGRRPGGARPAARLVPGPARRSARRPARRAGSSRSPPPRSRCRCPRWSASGC